MQFTTGVPVTVKLVPVVVFQMVAALPVSVMLPVPKAIVRMLALVLAKVGHVKVNVLRSSVPLVSVTAPVVMALPSVQAPPTPSNVTAPPSATPLVVTVLPVVVAANVMVPV